MIYVVRTRDEFNIAAKKVVGSDQILLAPGEYSSLALRDRQFATPVTIGSLDPNNPATVDSINLTSSSNVTVTDLNFARLTDNITSNLFSHIRIDNTDKITIINNKFTGAVINDGSETDGSLSGSAVFSIKSNNTTIENNTMSALHKVVVLQNVSNSTIKNNTISQYREDAIFISNTNNVNIEGNYIYGTNRFSKDHPDFIQIMGVDDIVIRNNFMSQGYGTVSQGILVGPNKSNTGVQGGLLIDNNIIYSGMRDGIRIESIADVTISHNTVLTNLTNNVGDPSIFFVGDESINARVYGNIAQNFFSTEAFIENRGGSFFDNITVQYKDPNLSNYYGNFFNVLSKGGGATIEDFAVLASMRLKIGASIGTDIGKLLNVGTSELERDTINIPIDSGDADQNLGSGLVSFDDDGVYSFLPGAQDVGVAKILNDGAAVEISQNAWKFVDHPVVVNNDTVISFTFNALEAAEIYGIGFDLDGKLNSNFIFKLAGSQKWGIDAFDGVVPIGGGPVDVSIRVGEFFNGAFKGIVLVADDDAAGGGRAVISNLRIGDANDVEAASGAPQNIISTPALNSSTISSFSPISQDNGTATFIDDSLVVSENGWKKYSDQFVFTENTRARFDFKVGEVGEIHAIGFETDDQITSTRFFQLAGTQKWGLQDHVLDSAPTEWTTVDIAVGDYVRGAVDRLVFVADNDATAVGESWFRNVVIYEM